MSDELKVCPICRGNKFVISPRSHIDRPCEMCDGHGFVIATNICVCGRPAVRKTPLGLACTHVECFDKVMKAM